MKSYFNAKSGAFYAAKIYVPFGLMLTLIIASVSVYVTGNDQYIIVVPAAFAGAIIILTILLRPQLATLSYLFIACTNIAVIGYRFYNVPIFIAGSTFLLVLIPFVGEIFIRRRSLLIDTPFILLLTFNAILFLSFFMAKDQKIAIDYALTFIVEGLVVYLLIINVIRDHEMLRKAIWVIILSGALLGALSLYQKVTGSYDNQFGGLSLSESSKQKDSKKISIEKRTANPYRQKKPKVRRAQGPIGEKNYYAQIMLMFLPLAFFRFREERSSVLKLISFLCFTFILCGILLTYSRGAFLILCLIMALMVGMRIVRLRYIVILLIIITGAVFITAPGYFERMTTIIGVKKLSSIKQSRALDISIRGRATEMLAALRVFKDYPILGVGPGQYSPFYSLEYMSKDDIAFKRITVTRRAHNLYLELAAETGILGLVTFVTIAVIILFKLWSANRLLKVSQPEIANTAAALFLAIVSYLGAGMFLSFSYQRYYWLIIALAGAAIQIINTEKNKPVGYQNQKVYPDS